MIRHLSVVACVHHPSQPPQQHLPEQTAPDTLGIAPPCVCRRAAIRAPPVMTILGFTSTRSSGRAYTLAPIFRAIEMAYLPGRREEE